MTSSQDDFKEFLASNSSEPNSKLSESITSRIKNDLNPSHFNIFLKVLCIQAFIGFITMIFCPQFSLSLTNNFELFHYFHHNFGAKICSAICGAIFIGSGAVFSVYTLSYAEVLRIKKSKILYYLSLSSIALTGFIFISSEVYLDIALYWFAGASLSSILLFEANLLVKKQLISMR